MYYKIYLWFLQALLEKLTNKTCMWCRVQKTYDMWSQIRPFAWSKDLMSRNWVTYWCWFTDQLECVAIQWVHGLVCFSNIYTILLGACYSTILASQQNTGLDLKTNAILTAIPAFLITKHKRKKKLIF